MASAGVFQPSTRLAFLSTRLAGNALPRLLPVLKVSHGCPGNGRKHSPLRHMGLDTVGLVAAAIATLVHRIRHRKRFLPWLSMVALTIAATAFLGTAGWALNHYAPELSRDLGLESSAQRGPAGKRHRVLSGPSRQPRVTGSARGGRYSPNRTSTSSQALPKCRISRSPSAMRSSREALHP